MEDIEAIQGLEHLVAPKVCWVIVQNRRETIARVLEEHACQEEIESYDTKKIASASQASSDFVMEWRKRIVV